MKVFVSNTLEFVMEFFCLSMMAPQLELRAKLLLRSFLSETGSPWRPLSTDTLWLILNTLCRSKREPRQR